MKTNESRKINFAKLVKRYGDVWAICGAMDARRADDNELSDAIRSSAGMSAARNAEIGDYLVMRYWAYRRSVM